MQGEQVLENVVSYILSPLYELVVVCTVIYFLYGVLVFMANGDDAEKKNQGKQHMLYGTIGLFIILSVGGILKVFNDVFSGVFVF